jgi:hypothetical protein
MRLSKSEMSNIVIHGFIDYIISNCYDKLETCGAIGIVIQIDIKKESYIFKYELYSGNYGFIKIKYQSLKPNSIIFYHDNEEDVVTQAALQGDIVITDEDIIVEYE